jgi:hypothetical protein
MADIGEPFRWLWRTLIIGPPGVPEAERRRHSFAYRTRSARRGEGWLVLTNDALVFERSVPFYTMARWMPSPNFSVFLRDITDAFQLPSDLGDTSPFVPVLAICLAAGEMYFVQLSDVDAWLKLLGDSGVPVAR